MTENTIVVGKEARTGGAVYIFERQGDGSWLETQRLTPSDSQEVRFGISVSIWGNDLIVGASVWVLGLGSDGRRPGSAYIFSRQPSGSWVEVQRLYASTEWNTSQRRETNGFGLSVSISNDTAVVGAYNGQSTGRIAGSAFIFERQEDGVWVETNNLSPADVRHNDYFGNAVSISLDTILIGAYQIFSQAPPGVPVGAVYFAERPAFQCYAQGDKAGDCLCAEWADGADCSGRPSCGDGVQQPTERCDDGNTLPGDGCDELCNLE